MRGSDEIFKIMLMKKEGGKSYLDIKLNMKWPNLEKCRNIELPQLCED